MSIVTLNKRQFTKASRKKNINFGLESNKLTQRTN